VEYDIMIASMDGRDVLLDAAITQEGYIYVGSERINDFGTEALCVYIDKEGGVTADDCGKVSRVLSVRLPAEGLLPERECLQVSSPGLNRPLFKLEHYNDYVGKYIQVKLFASLDGRRRFKGVLQAVLADGIEVVVDAQVFTLPIGAIEKANVCFSESVMPSK
jgi:ribosome maturation factor RimP